MIFHRWRPHTGGFTLVELLVVSAIVALLASLLLPALSVAKERSQSIYCLNSLKQMAVSSKMYVDENSGFFPWTFTLTGDQLKRETWFTYLKPYQESQRLWLCPARPKKIPFAPISPAGLFQRSPDGEIIYPSSGAVANYAFNIELGGCYYEGLYSVKPQRESVPTSRTSDTVLISDSGSQVVNTTNPKLCVTPQSPVKPGAFILADPSSSRFEDAFKTTTDDLNWCGPRLRHLEKANVLFLDGHAEPLSASWYYAGTPYLKPSGIGR